MGAGRPTYKIAAFFPVHDDLGSLAELGKEWEAAFKLSVGLANADPSFKVAFSYILVDGGPTAESCSEAAKVIDTFTMFLFFFLFCLINIITSYILLLSMYIFI